MSGHSKWANIKHKKGLRDIDRSKQFTKLARDIRMAVQKGGTDIETNPALRLAVSKAKAANMTVDKIKDNISRAGGNKAGSELIEIIYEVNAGNGLLLLIRAITDNSNRSFTEIRNIVNKSEGKIASVGSVLWQFEQKGIILIVLKDASDYERLLEFCLEQEGVQDVIQDNNEVTILVDREALTVITQSLLDAGYVINQSELDYLASNEILIDKADEARLEEMTKLLEENQDVDKVWTNF